MEIKVTKKDIIWSYVAQFFTVGTGIITLPVVLKMLNADEIGLNYILISITSMVGLFDMGFSSQFSRYLTYIFSGSQSIQKEGIAMEYSDNINEHLLAVTIRTARTIYLYLSFIALLILASFGTIYIYHVTNGFTTIKNVTLIWIIFCISSFFTIYYLYLNAFLLSKGLIKESKKATVFSRLTQITITFAMLFAGYGLLSVVIANLIAPFVLRYLSHKVFFNDYINNILSSNTVAKKEIRNTFLILFYNAKKIGIISIMASMLWYASTLVIGVFLPLAVVGSYGIMVQLVGVIGNMSVIYLTSKMPQLSNYLVQNKHEQLRKEFGFSMFVFYLIYIVGLTALMVAPLVFTICGFNVQLPSYTILVVYGLTRVIEQNQSAFCQLFVIQNKLIYFKSAILTCIASFLLLILFLLVDCGLLGVVLAQTIPLFAYCAWKWPLYTIKKFGISFKKDIILTPIYIIKNKMYVRNK